jgi:hypothetical protein
MSPTLGVLARSSSCSPIAHDKTTHSGTKRHETTQEDTWNRDACVARATLGSGREAVEVRVCLPSRTVVTGGSLL